LLAIQAIRSVRHTAARPSRASPAPTGIAPILWERACSRFRRCDQSGTPRRGHRGQARLPQALRRPCGSGLARDSGDTISQAHRGAAIAGKPGSHRHCADLVGAGLLAIQAMRSVRHTAARPSRASPAPTGIAPTLWERACSRFRRYDQSGHRGATIAGKPGSHRHCADLVGAGLLAIQAMRCIRHITSRIEPPAMPCAAGRSSSRSCSCTRTHTRDQTGSARSGGCSHP